ncbi:probable protein arginine N-methyltransferase 3 [Phragmites australis]|uniref:probable protein arginine N-methyltransferase 3 n=1 Tax=Phragmites australis TaxID=29695 RepID=UPI002D7733BB|nr:probable protein arginine N-methyltransferase 3 [Phragmites australis]
MECSHAEPEERLRSEDDEEEEEEEDCEGQDGWDDWCSDGDDTAAGLLCLFCSSRFDADSPLFSHCGAEHRFDFCKTVKELGLDFYGRIKLINFIRSKVAEDKCWSCGQVCSCNSELCSHLHAQETHQIEGNFPWEDDAYLKPFMEDDPLLHSLSIGDDEDEDEDCGMSMERGQWSAGSGGLAKPGENELSTITEGNGSDISARFEQECTIGRTEGDGSGSLAQEQNDTQLKVARASVNAKAIKSVDDNYFGSYSAFGIHREMLGDKVRTDAYRDALLDNPSLMNGATVLDVGCGTGILSLFAAKAGASRVVAVDGSEKMVSVATQVSKNNGLLHDENKEVEQKRSPQVINVVHTKAEELNHKIQIPPSGFDVLVSEWMGYCLLYESMLSSVLYARDHFLKPGGAILPDTATILGAGFGKGGTSLLFWENVYGFDMSCIGKEVTSTSARFPVVDVVSSQDIVTETAVLHSFDLATMKETEMDFTASFELRLSESGTVVHGVTWCYGIVLWFDTGFTVRFCKEKPVILSTSPFSTPTHWSQTIFTFEEPIAMSKEESLGSSGSVGTDECPAMVIRSRISIVRASEHRSIDISVETTAISSDGRKRSWPVQIFNL